MFNKCHLIVTEDGYIPLYVCFGKIVKLNNIISMIKVQNDLLISLAIANTSILHAITILLLF